MKAIKEEPIRSYNYPVEDGKFVDDPTAMDADGPPETWDKRLNESTANVDQESIAFASQEVEAEAKPEAEPVEVMPHNEILHHQVSVRQYPQVLANDNIIIPS